MYFFIRVILGDKRYIGWAELIADKLHEGLSCFGNKNFYMSSYLLYWLACTRPWSGLYHEAWIDGIKTYEYHPHLQQQGSFETIASCMICF